MAIYLREKQDGAADIGRERHPRLGPRPIPGTRRITYLEENVGAAALALSASDLARLDAAMPPGAAAGGRYPEEGMTGVEV